VHLPSRFRAFTRCGRKRSHFDLTVLGADDEICSECAGVARHEAKGRHAIPPPPPGPSSATRLRVGWRVVQTYEGDDAVLSISEARGTSLADAPVEVSPTLLLGGGSEEPSTNEAETAAWEDAPEGGCVAVALPAPAEGVAPLTRSGGL